MDDDICQIHGLEYNARALAPQLGESENVRFLVGTQSLKIADNQVQLVEVNEESHSLVMSYYDHGRGEIWNLAASPNDSNQFSSVYNTLAGDNSCSMRTSIWKFPEIDDEDIPLSHTTQNLRLLTDLQTESFGTDIKTTIFHPTDSTKAITIIDNKFIQWDIGQDVGKVSSVGVLEAKSQPKLTTGKWNPFQNCTQLVTTNESHVKCWDLRANSKSIWGIENAHCHVVRDLDFNPNKQYYLATCGDDGLTKFWDSRNVTEPLVVLSDHSHWVWNVRYNPVHDQLVLTSSSDSRVILTCVASISSEPFQQTFDDDNENENENENNPKERLADGVLATYEEHEDSVYAVEWSSQDPWTFASLSYDGRLVISKVPKAEKFKILKFM